jgi:bacterioferritin-associated ferredoxin
MCVSAALTAGMPREMMRLLRRCLKNATDKDRHPVIICICRGKSDRDVTRAIEAGASSVRDLQRCGIGDQCGSCHDSLRGMLARAAAEIVTPAMACPACAAAASPASAAALA